MRYQGIQSYEDMAKAVREHARTEMYHKGASVKYEDIARHLPSTLDPRFIAEQCELIGCPVWASCPKDALYGVVR